MKKVKLLLLIVFFTLTLSGCSKTAFLNKESKESKKIAFISMKQGGQLWGNIKNGARMAHEETGCLLDFYAPIEETDSFSQIEYLEEAAKGDFDAIIIAPCDFTLLSTTIQKIQRQGATVLQIYNETIAYDGFQQFKMMTDFSPVGDAIADFVISNTKNEPLHALIVGSLLHTSAGSQTEMGIKLNFKDNNNIDFETVYCFGDSERAKKLVTEKLNKDDSINFIIALDETSSTGITEAMNSREDNSKIKVLAWGNTISNITGLENGSVDGIIAINGFGLGYRSIYAALDLIDGKPVPTTPLDFAIVTKDTFLNNRNQRLLFPQLL
jgi:ribose transport system substrate-binding protein